MNFSFYKNFCLYSGWTGKNQKIVKKIITEAVQGNIYDYIHMYILCDRKASTLDWFILNYA